MSFEYYLIKVKNKTNEVYIVNFYEGKKKMDEYKVTFVIKPNEIKTGTCKYNSVKLKIIKSNGNLKNKNINNEFSLSNINVIEVY